MAFFAGHSTVDTIERAGHFLYAAQLLTIP
jgi:hypothetical protein